jgi:outer membrane lipoprotein SlyB
MFKMAFLAGSAGLFALTAAGTAEAQHGYGPTAIPVHNVQCERQKSADGRTGAVVGALAGALIGGAIGNNIDNDRYVTRYGRRGPPVTYRESRSNSGEVAVGATLGALAGGLAGSGIGRSSGPDCQVAYAPPAYTSVPGGSIPQTTRGLYGGAQVMRGAPSVPAPYPRSPLGYPTSSHPAWPGYPPQADDPGAARAPDAGEAACQLVHRETRMPDGQVFRDPVTVCRDLQSGQWRVEENLQEELYGS